MEMPGSLKIILAVLFFLVLLTFVGSGYASSEVTKNKDDIAELNDEVDALDAQVAELTTDVTETQLKTQYLTSSNTGSTFTGDLFVLNTGDTTAVNVGNSLRKQTYDTTSNTQTFNCNVNIPSPNTLTVGGVDVGYSIDNLNNLINEGLYELDSLTLDDLTVKDKATITNATISNLTFSDGKTQTTSYTGGTPGTYQMATFTIGDIGKIIDISSNGVLSDALALSSTQGTNYWGRYFELGNLIFQFSDLATYGFPQTPSQSTTTITFPKPFAKDPYFVSVWSVKNSGGNNPVCLNAITTANFTVSIASNSASIGFIAIGSK